MWSAFVNLVAPEPTLEDNLFISIQQGRTDKLVEWIDTKGLDSLKQLKYGESELTVFQAACLYGNLEATLKLIDFFSIVETTGKGANTPAHLAAMSGHSKIVDLLIERGASVCIKNQKGQNVFDIAQGLQLRQNLMKAVLDEENRTGTAPVLSGVTRDLSKDQEKFKNLGPPPTSFPIKSTSAVNNLDGSTPLLPQPPILQQQRQQQYQDSQYMIQPDGFVTTVGNPNLAAKYGNQTQSRLVSGYQGPSQPTTSTTPPPIPLSNFIPQNPQARYVSNIPGVNILPPTSRPSPNPTFKPLPQMGPPKKINSFDPSQISSSQQDQRLPSPTKTTNQ